MASINTNSNQKTTHAGGIASNISAVEELERSVMSCLLWENNFYEDGKSHAERIQELVQKVDSAKVADIAVRARNEMKLRHIPLLLAVCLARKKYSGIAELIYNIIQRADELTEFLSIYWKDGKCSLSNQVKKGLAKAFLKFNEYQLAKYNRDKPIKLRDVLFLVHAKPDTKEREVLWKKLADRELPTPDTWEVNLSAGKDKKETFERLMLENKLGGLAFLRNLRNFYNSGVANDIVEDYFERVNLSKVLPFRFLSAAIHAPQYALLLQAAFLKKEFPKLKGKTIFLVDVSGSMEQRISNKSEINRMDTAAMLTFLGINYCENSTIYTFSDNLVKVPVINNFNLITRIIRSQPKSSTYLDGALLKIAELEKEISRLIIITDEQSSDNVYIKKGNVYILNVGIYQNGISYGQAIHINGFSENVLDYIVKYEKKS